MQRLVCVQTFETKDKAMPLLESLKGAGCDARLAVDPREGNSSHAEFSGVAILVPEAEAAKAHTFVVPTQGLRRAG